jgi:hypothetical protein
MSRILGRLASTVLVAALLAVAGVPLDVLATATFGAPTAAASWEEGVTFRQPVVLEERPLRVEIVVESSDDTSAFVAEIPATATGSTTLAYTLDVATGGYLPNTPFTARWRVTYPDGTTDIGPPISTTYEDTRFDWRTSTGSIVRVHWYDGDTAFGARALRIGEEAVAKAAGLLGVTERDPVDFFVYADEESFYDALGPGTRENVGGQANSEIRTLFALITPDEIDDAWVGAVIPHELTHLVFDTAVANPYHYPPRWLNEGVAVYLSQGYDASDRSTVERAARDGELMPLDALTAEFPTTAQRFGLAYAESVSAVDYLVRTHGTDGLVRLVRSYADGRSDEEAFAAAIGVDATRFGQAWLAELDAPEPVRYGPQPAPPGPLPSDWQGPPPAGGTTGPGPGVSASPDGAGRPAETPGAPSLGAPIRTRDVATGLAVAAVLLGVAGLGLFVMGRRRRSALPRNGLVAETGEVTEPPKPSVALVDDEAPTDARS